MNNEKLQELLQAAVELELSTIPPYLCALYSLRDGANDEARLIIRSVAVEEMLHMVLAANTLNAIGGRPRVAGSEYVPRYPHELPDGVVLDLLPFCPEAVEMFLKVENPQYDLHALSADHPLVKGRRREHHRARAGSVSGDPKTIGAFYSLIIDGLEEAVASRGEAAVFTGDPGLQVGRDYYYAGGGKPIEVTDLASARAALTEIVDQGEGDMSSMYDSDGDLAHYYRFQQIQRDRAYLPTDEADRPTGPPVGTDYTAVYPMAANPHSGEYRDPALRAASDSANRTWSRLLRQLDNGFNGKPDALLDAVPTMFQLRDDALTLLANPMPGVTGRNAGPAFEWDPAGA